MFIFRIRITYYLLLFFGKSQIVNTKALEKILFLKGTDLLHQCMVIDFPWRVPYRKSETVFCTEPSAKERENQSSQNNKSQLSQFVLNPCHVWDTVCLFWCLFLAISFLRSLKVCSVPCLKSSHALITISFERCQKNSDVHKTLLNIFLFELKLAIFQDTSISHCFTSCICCGL